MTVNSVSVNQLPPRPQRHTVIKSAAHSPVILFFHFGSSYLDDARDELIAQCPNGSIEGIIAKDESANYFLGLVTVYGIKMQGFCVGAKGPRKA